MAEFSEAIRALLRNEGGHANHPRDRGGETKFGISKRSFPDVDVARLTAADAERLYRQHFWAPHPQLAALKSQAVANKVFDLMVNMGPARGVRVLQQAVNVVAPGEHPVPIDGRLGPLTAARVNELNVEELLAAMRAQAARNYCDIVKKRPDQGVFLRGWLLRAHDRPSLRSEPTPQCPAD